ncbi:hypothetical protein B0O99DRAFT_463072, partial [Bisporella sp. PMI_857]
KRIFNIINSAIKTDFATAYFFLQKASNCNKTFLYKTICYYYCIQKTTVLYIIFTGIAALLLLYGRTFYLQFEI